VLTCLHSTYEFSTKRCADDFYSGKYDHSFDLLVKALTQMDQTRQQVMDTLVITNFYERIWPKRADVNPDLRDRTQGVISLRDRLMELEPKVLWYLKMDTDPRAAAAVKEAAKYVGIPLVMSWHPARHESEKDIITNLREGWLEAQIELERLMLAELLKK
jgi:hypothetical protein